jgi:uncharacterized protein
MKRVVIVHCWDGSPNYCWYPYAKRELLKRGFKVEAPVFPDTEEPKLEKWLPKLKEVVGEPDDSLFLIGHSVGCITILRYLESFSENQKIGGAVFVAGFTDDLGFEELKNFFTTPIDFEKIKKGSKSFVAIHSDDDPFVPMEHADIFKEKLGAKVIVKNKAGHFSGPVDDERGCLELPEVVESIVSI